MGVVGSAAAELPCTACVGIRTDDPLVGLSALMGDPTLCEDGTFFLSWTISLDEPRGELPFEAVRLAGATPWLRVVFHTSSPIAENRESLESELEELATLVRSAGRGVFVQAVWQPREGSIDAREHAYLIKRAAVVP
jgi:hypothetical protein